MIIGIDPGLANAALVVLDDHSALVDVRSFTSVPRDRPMDMQCRVAELLQWAESAMPAFADCIVVEWPVVGARDEGSKGARSLSAMAQSFAAACSLFGMLRERCSHFYAPMPMSWRAAIAPGVDTITLHQRLDLGYGLTKRIGATRAKHALDALGCALYGHLQLHGDVVEQLNHLDQETSRHGHERNVHP